MLGCVLWVCDPPSCVLRRVGVELLKCVSVMFVSLTRLFCKAVSLDFVPF